MFQKRQYSCRSGIGKKRGLFQWFLSLFTSKGEKAQTKDEKRMAEFAETQLIAGQREVNALIDCFADPLGTVDSYEKVSDALMEAYDTVSLEGLSYLIDKIRYAAHGIGGAHG